MKINKPAPQPKKEKQPVQQAKPKEKKPKDDEEEEEDYVEKVKKFTIIVNMEDIKRHFFMNEIPEFNEEVRKHGLHFYEGNYKYNSDKDGAPEFSASNLLKGIVKQLDNSRKYLMTVFRCYKVGENYEYKSLWIVNTNDDFKEVIGDLHDDFEFTTIEDGNINNFLIDMNKKMIGDEYPVIDDKTLIGEVYVH